MTALTNAPITADSSNFVRTPLRLISNSRQSKAYIWGTIVTVVAFSLCALLVHMNLALAEQSRELRDHSRNLKSLTEEETVLRGRVADQQTPRAICEKAKALGMVPMGTVRHLSLKDGSVVGQKTSGAEIAAPC